MFAVLAHAALWSLFFWTLISRVPIYEQRFQDFQIKLPFYCEPVIELSHLVRLHFYVEPLLLAPLLVLGRLLVLAADKRLGLVGQLRLCLGTARGGPVGAAVGLWHGRA